MYFWSLQIFDRKKIFWKKQFFSDFFVSGVKIGLKIDPKTIFKRDTPWKSRFFGHLGPIKKVYLELHFFDRPKIG